MNVKNFFAVEPSKANFYLVLIATFYIFIKDDAVVEGMPQDSETELINSAIKRLNPCERAVWRYVLLKIEPWNFTVLFI